MLYPPRLSLPANASRLLGTEVSKLPLFERRDLLHCVLKRSDHVDVVDWSDDFEVLEQFARQHNLEGIVAKRPNSRYEAGKRTGSWLKLRYNCRQEFVIGGYTPSDLGLDALLVGFYKDKQFCFAAAVRGGFTPGLRRRIHDSIKHLETAKCPFVNVPDRRPGSFGQGLTKEKMKICRWLKTAVIAEIEFAEWTPDERLRHSAFLGMRTDKSAHEVSRET